MGAGRPRPHTRAAQLARVGRAAATGAPDSWSWRERATYAGLGAEHFVFDDSSASPASLEVMATRSNPGGSEDGILRVNPTLGTGAPGAWAPLRPAWTDCTTMRTMQVREIMTSPVISTSAEATVAALAELLVRHRISGVPVLDQAGSLVGVVSEHDLLAKPGDTAAEVMTTALVTVTEDAEVDDVRHLLVERRIGRVPVLAGGRLVGIVSRSDVVAILATEWVCRVCGEPVRGSPRPPGCPRCHGGQDRFVLQEQPPGS